MAKKKVLCYDVSKKKGSAVCGYLFSHVRLLRLLPVVFGYAGSGRVKSAEEQQ